MKRFFFPILMSAMLVYGGKASAQTDKVQPKSVKPLPASKKPAVAPVSVKPLPPAPTAGKPVPVQRPAAAPAPITAKPIQVAPRPLPSSAKPVPVAGKPAPVTKPVPVVTKPVPVAQKPVTKTAPAAAKSKAKKAVAGKKKASKKNVEIVTNEPVYTPAPAYREPERVNIEQRHEGPTVVEIKDQKIKVNDETVARLNNINDCIRITVDHKSEINLVPEKKECVKERRCCHGKMTRYCYMMEHKCKPSSSECKHECKPAGKRPMRPCRYNY